MKIFNNFMNPLSLRKLPEFQKVFIIFTSSQKLVQCTSAINISEPLTVIHFVRTGNWELMVQLFKVFITSFLFFFLSRKSTSSEAHVSGTLNTGLRSNCNLNLCSEHNNGPIIQVHQSNNNVQQSIRESLSSKL